MTYKTYTVDEKVNVIILDIDDSVNKEIERSISSICEGLVDTDLDALKIRLKDYLLPKNLNQRRGAIAEFFIHLFLKELGYKQNFLFLNLEENSIKKGFDGYYTFNGDEWIVESKSGGDVTHKDKIKEAYNDLNKKLTTKEKNNPWQNAYNHASLVQVGADQGILKRLKALSNDYFKGKMLPITDFNLMPCGTVFGHDASELSVKEALYEEIKSLPSGMAFNNLCLIAISNRAYTAFLKFIGLEE